MKCIYFLALMSVLLVGCSPNIQYIGRNYRATDDVDLYFNSNDIKRDYETMGRVEGTGGIIYSDYSDIQEEIVKMAKRKGADGVLIYDMEKRTIGQNANTTSRVGTNNTDIFGRKSVAATTSTTTSTLTSNALRADFIKYK